MSNIANTHFDVGVTRDPNADTKVNVETSGGPKDIGVNHTSSGTDANPRDLPSMPVHKTRNDKDGPTAYNPKKGTTNAYQR